ncbi:MAG: hypothetical protein IJA67_06620, partial [Oscillospiraceae bacterium]|nr:hypothetical protein [Oscillospiraceae bacterium]
MMHAFQQQSHEIHAHGGSHKPPCASSVHRRRFQKAKPLAAAVRSTAIHCPLPSGAGAVTAEPPPCAVCRSEKTVSKGESLWRRRCAAPPSIAPPFGSRGGHGRAPLVHLPLTEDGCKRRKPLAAAVRSTAIHRPLPSGAGAVTAEPPPPCASAAHRRRLQKAKAFGSGGAQHRHPSPPPFGSRGSHGRAAPLVQSAAHRKRFQKAKAFGGGGAQHRHPSSPPFGSRGGHGRAPLVHLPLTEGGFKRRKPLAAAVRSTAIHRPLPSGAGAVTAEPP